MIGAGRSSQSMLISASRLATAAHVADAARALRHPSRSWFRSTDVRVRGLVAQLQDDERLLGFVEAELAGLLDHEAVHHGGLLSLLRQYIELGGNKAALAQATHISRQALYGRLRRLEQVLGVGLDDPDSMLSLGVALMAYDIRGRAPAR